MNSSSYEKCIQIKSECEVIFLHSVEYVYLNLFLSHPAFIDIDGSSTLKEVIFGPLYLTKVDSRQLITGRFFELLKKLKVSHLRVFHIKLLLVDLKRPLSIIGPEVFHDILRLFLDNDEGFSIYDMLLLDTEKIPNAPPDNFNQTCHERKHGGFGYQLND